VIKHLKLLPNPKAFSLFSFVSLVQWIFPFFLLQTYFNATIIVALACNQMAKTMTGQTCAQVLIIPLSTLMDDDNKQCAD